MQTEMQMTITRKTGVAQGSKALPGDHSITHANHYLFHVCVERKEPVLVQNPNLIAVSGARPRFVPNFADDVHDGAVCGGHSHHLRKYPIGEIERMSILRQRMSPPRLRPIALCTKYGHSRIEGQAHPGHENGIHDRILIENHWRFRHHGFVPHAAMHCYAQRNAQNAQTYEDWQWDESRKLRSNDTW